MIARYNRYILSLLSWPLLLVVFCMTSIIWLTQALRFIDFIINRGLTIWDFLHITLLLIPSLLVIILPVAFFVAVIFCYNRLAGDSELVVMEASGISPMQLAKPAILLGLAVTLLGYLNALYLLPTAERHFQEMESFLKNNYTSVLLQEEVFNHPTPGLTVFIRERKDDGTLHGILVNDSRVPAVAVTMMAETGKLIQTARGPRFLLAHGMRQENKQGEITWLDFDSYNLDISLYDQNPMARTIDEKERYLPELFDLSHTDAKDRGRYLAEAHRRLTWPLYTLGLGLLAVAVLLGGEFNRRGRWKRITLLTAGALGVVLLSFELTNLVTRFPAAFPLMYLSVATVLLASLGLLWQDGRPRARLAPRSVYVAEGG